MYIDTHCHLETQPFKDDFDAVVKRAKEAEVEGFILPGADPKDLESAQKIASENSGFFYSAGVHPYHAREYDEHFLKQFLSDPNCIAVGECGMDYYRLPKELSQKEQEKQIQQECFIKQIELANRYNKPLIVHIREASDISKELLLQYAKVGGVLHCYNASEHLLDLAQKGFYFGIGGVLTFKNAKKIKEVLSKVPLNKIVVETDAPYLTPHPHRGTRNEPAYIPLIVAQIAQILDMDRSSVNKQILQNTQTLFKEFQSIDRV